MVMVTGPRAEKALRLYDEHSVYLSQIDRHRALVKGDGGFHKVVADKSGVACDCKAWRPSRYCSHALAAMLAWQDAEERERALVEAA
jgi:hypothetical protein